MIAKVKGVTRELQETVDDAIKNSELDDIRKEISLTDPELSKNLKEIMEPSTSKNLSNINDNKSNEDKKKLKKEKNKISNSDSNIPKKIVAKKDLPSGLKHIRDNNVSEDKNISEIKK